MVKKRNWFVVCLLAIITLGIYGIYWVVKTKNELVELGASIPTAFLMIVPFANFYFYWKYAKGVEQVSNGEASGVAIFVLWLFFPPVAIYLVQKELNKHVEESQPEVETPKEEVAEQ